MSAADAEPTRVVFRVWRKSISASGAVIALFPDIDEGCGLCSSYEHVGQHSGANYRGVVSITRPAKPSEYADLAEELKSIGYVLDIRERR